LGYIFSDADILIKLVRSELWDYFEQLISALNWNIYIPAYVLHTEIQKCDSPIYNFLCKKIKLNVIQEIDTPVEINNPINLLFSQFSRHVDSGEAYVFALAESMNAIVLTDNLNDFIIIGKGWFSFFEAKRNGEG